MANRDTAKGWFQTGKFPTQSQFYQLFDWLLFSGEVAVGDIAGLATLLSGKTEKTDFDGFVKGNLILVNADYVYLQTANTLLENIVFIPGADCTLKIGTTNGGEEIMMSTDILLSDRKTWPLILNNFVDANTNLYVNGIPAGSKLIALQRPIKTS